MDVPVASINCRGSARFADGTSRADSGWYKCSPDFELVAGSPYLNKDTCHGDSGGPIFFHADNGRGGYDEYLVGITSRAVRSPHARDCGDGGVYERVDGDVLKWLTDTGHVDIHSEKSGGGAAARSPS